MIDYAPQGKAATAFGYAGGHIPSTSLGTGSEEREGAVLRRRYVWGPGDDEPVVWYEGAGSGDRRWYHADERGSIKKSGAHYLSPAYRLRRQANDLAGYHFRFTSPPR